MLTENLSQLNKLYLVLEECGLAKKKICTFELCDVTSWWKGLSLAQADTESFTIRQKRNIGTERHID